MNIALFLPAFQTVLSHFQFDKKYYENLLLPMLHIIIIDMLPWKF